MLLSYQISFLLFELHDPLLLSKCLLRQLLHHLLGSLCSIHLQGQRVKVNHQQNHLFGIISMCMKADWVLCQQNYIAILSNIYFVRSMNTTIYLFVRIYNAISTVMYLFLKVDDAIIEVVELLFEPLFVLIQCKYVGHVLLMLLL